jgi:SAM-dependent methyltransferase
MDQLNIDNFACPSCRAPLKGEGEALACVSCQARWPVQDGVPDFRLVRDRYWGEYPPETMDRLLEVCREQGWRKGLNEFFQARDPGYVEYLTDTRRANWSYLLSLPRQARILDAGCGWGALSFPLAGRFGEVYGLDIVPQRSAFVRLRGRQDRVAGVVPVCGQVTRLPFGDAFFDLAVLNGVLEWIPSTEDGDPQKVQEAALREVYRVLKPGGVLYLAIENRWAAINFLGFRDTHSGLRFAPILPRGLAQLYSRLARKKDFREYTYTYGELRRMLVRAGFGPLCFFAPLPSYRRFYYFLPIENVCRVRFFLRKLVWSRNRLQRFFVNMTNALRLDRLVKVFVPDFSILAQKEAGPVSRPVCRDMILHQGVERTTRFLFDTGQDRPSVVEKLYHEGLSDRWVAMCS